MYTKRIRTRNTILSAIIGLFFAGWISTVEQAAAQENQGMEVAGSTQISNVQALNDEGSVLEVAFSQQVEPFDRFDVEIIHNLSRERKGVRRVDMNADRTGAVLFMYRTAELERLQEYTMEIYTANRTLTNVIHRSHHLEEVKMNEMKAEDVQDRRVTLESDHESETVTVPENIDIDLVQAFNKDMQVKINGHDEMISYEILPEDEIDREDSFVGQYDMPHHFLIRKKQGSTVSGTNEELDLSSFVLVKNNQRITQDKVQPGDMVLFNEEENIAEVYNQKVQAPIERVFEESFDVDGTNYDYSGSFIEKDGDTDSFDEDTAEVFENSGDPVTLYLDPDDSILAVTMQ